MAEIKIDSWNSVQLERLRRFFREEAKAGDRVIFDRRLAEDNAAPHEGLNDQGCNSWVYEMANRAFEGMEPETVNALADSMTLTTAYLHAQYPERLTEKAPADPQLEPEDSSYDEDLDFDWPEPEDNAEPARDNDAEEWARVKDNFRKRNEPAL